MPRVKLAPDEKADRAKSMRIIILSKSAARDIRTQAELARRAGMRAGTLTDKLAHGAWTAADLAKLDKVLRFSAEELAAIVRA